MLQDVDVEAVPEQITEHFKVVMLQPLSGVYLTFLGFSREALWNTDGNSRSANWLIGTCEAATTRSMTGSRDSSVIADFLCGLALWGCLRTGEGGKSAP